MPANALTNPGFETATGWNYNAFAGRDTAEVHAGSYAGFAIVLPAGGIGGWDVGTLTQMNFPTTPDADHPVRLWINGDLRGDTGLAVYIDKGSGYDLLAELDTFSAGWVQWEVGSFRATASNASIQITPISATQIGLWYFDDVEVGSMAKTALITAAIVSDLGDISTTNGFSTDVAEVSQEPKIDILYPGLSLRPLGNGSADEETLTNRMGQAVQLYEVACHVRSSTPYAAMQNLLDDVRNSVERSSSAVLALGDANYAVRDVVVSEWTSTETSTDIDLYKASMTVTVEVSYTYNRGSV